MHLLVLLFIHVYADLNSFFLKFFSIVWVSEAEPSSPPWKRRGLRVPSPHPQTAHTRSCGPLDALSGVCNTREDGRGRHSPELSVEVERGPAAVATVCSGSRSRWHPARWFLQHNYGLSSAASLTWLWGPSPTRLSRLLMILQVTQ